MPKDKPVASARQKAKPERKAERRRVRYAVVGLGHIAQAAVLPAFAHAKDNTELAALVTDDPVKLRALAKRYRVPSFTYEQYEECLDSGAVDAVYIALPNHLHCEYAVRAAGRGIHVLCEKPMALSEDECQHMIEAARANDVRLMVAYRLHFERANLEAWELARSGKLGEVRVFQSMFCMRVQPGNIRLRDETGGGTLWDIGVYCINAARHVFGEEPVEVLASSVSSGEPRFAEVDEATGAILRFPGGRLASFVTSFGTADVSSWRIAGTKAELRVEPAFDYETKLVHHLTHGGKTKTKRFARRDQFAPELLHFSECVLEGRDPEPGGREGLADVRVVLALYESARTGQAVRLEPFRHGEDPSLAQEQRRRPAREPELVHAEAPTE